MEKKQTIWKTKGMNQDLSVSAFNNEFSFENMNLRLSTNEGNTLMSWVNEKGTKEMSLRINQEYWDNIQGYFSFILEGVPIGTAVINHQLVLFTTIVGGVSNTPDRIYVLKISDSVPDTLEGILLFRGKLNFKYGHPLETLVSYESDTVQKVYWTDGVNQPRVINIAAGIDKIKKWNDSTDEPVATYFDFVPALSGNEEITITKHTSSGGIFAPGVIQYALSYVNIYGQQSNLFYVSPLYYLSPYDRGARPDEKVTASFEIKISNVDQKFDYLRIYSIQRTSLNDTPIVKLLDTLATTNTDLEYTDSGTTGASMDPTELLFIGGKEITALTMVDKDQTLFLGNLEEKNSDVSAIQDFYDDPLNSEYRNVVFKNDGEYKKIVLDRAMSIYSHTNTLNDESRNITTFKGGETYRFGFQLQKKTGEWSEPIFIEDFENNCYPKTSIYENQLNLVYAQAEIPISNFADLINDFYSTYQRIRPVVVFPTIGDRTVLCQGVLNPTVFNVKDRKTSSPYSQASWYFRPYMFYDGSEAINLPSGIVTPIGNIIRASKDGQIPVDVHLPQKNCYVLVASASVDKMDYLISRGYVNGTFDGDRFIHRFYAVIKLDPVYVSSQPNQPYPNKDLNGYSYYAFISDAGWPGKNNESGAKDFNGVEYEFLYNMQSYVTDYKIYKDLELVPGTRSLRYVAPEDNADAPSVYNFTFEAGDYKYTIPFNSTNTDYDTVEVDDSGQAVEYRHYESLYTQGEYEADFNNFSDTDAKIAAAQKIEIQGSKKSIDKAYGESSETRPSITDESSNTQFFVDQSVVTFHSPDIEFDTEVQAYGTEGIYMRIIGIVPITANASAHAFVHTAMLGKMTDNIDTANATAENYNNFGKGELGTNVLHKNINPYAGKRLVSEFLWDDNYVIQSKETDANGNQKWIAADLRKFLVYPWHRKGSLNNDTRGAGEASSYLQQKKESNILYSINSGYLSSEQFVPFTKMGMQMILTENAEVMNYRLPKQMEGCMDVNYYPNIDKVLYSESSYKPIMLDSSTTPPTVSFSTKAIIKDATNQVEIDFKTELHTPVSMKYLSTSHAVLDFTTGASDSIPILPYVTYNKGDDENPNYDSRGNFVGVNSSDHTKVIKPYWEGDIDLKFKQDSIDATQFFNYNNELMPLNLLWLGELYKDVPNRFGGKGKEALRSNNWLVGGDAINISSNDSNVTLTWTQGDTYYQRYDCLKTYAMTNDDSNQLVEILSFMCETHTNIDGRYDRNRGQIDNTNMRPQNFNLLNPVYSQQDNFFTSKKIQTEEVISHHYPNHVTWSKTKESGADVDMWTNVTLASTMELDGDKGKISKLARLNDSLLAFQDTGISQILYNENVQIASTAGVPIEIANSGKVQGKRYISDTIGCSNKWSVCQTPSGIYFIDSHDKGIYLFNGQLQNLSVAGGFNSWSKNNIELIDRGWNPWDFEDFVAYYDKQNKDVLFINSETALAYSEKIGAFTSFYNYEDTAYLCNLDGRGFWIKADSPVQSYIWGHQEGEYCNFFDTEMPYWMTLVGNPDPQRDKTFTNLEFRACVDGDGEYSENTGKFTPTLPFSTLETWNEYQHGITALKNKIGHASMMHHTLDKESTLKRKFRIWRCDIPRDNAPLNTDAGLNVSRFKAKPLDRMRNPWIYLKLYKGDNTDKRVEIHDVMMSYYE